MTEPPTNPYRMPQQPYYQPPTQPPTQPQPQRRRGWILPVGAAVVVVLVGGGVGGYLWLENRSTSSPAGTPDVVDVKTSQAPAAAVAAAPPDVCTMLPKQEVERLVPDATVRGDSRESDYTVNFDCTWENLNISFGEYTRSRTIEVKIDQHKADGAKTGRAMAEQSYDFDYTSARYRETHKPTLKPGEKDYSSSVTDIPGVGDGAYAQYTWRRDKVLAYAYGQAFGRVGDMTIEVRFQAGQQRKDALVLTNDTKQSITEANAVREVSGIIGHVAKGLADWQAKHPGALASPKPAATTSPSARPTPSQSTLAAMPPLCQAASEAATALVPDAQLRTRALEDGNDRQTECRWLTQNGPASAGMKRLASVMITIHDFANRAGTADPVSAKGFYTKKYGSAKLMQDFIGDKRMTWGPLTDHKGLGEAAFSQYLGDRKNEFFNGGTNLFVRKGALVIEISYAGAVLPVDAANNSPKVKIFEPKEADAGAMTIAKAVEAYLKGGATGS
ncbi:hypothetical protein ACIBH1_08030 [Nonomuraea sp. NPDC050663]|uniref:hypothetical protein n=1 Tax=Nonomuraea sp. NPDC050663 TaxID=3364370 RepID=UPI0037B2DB89